MERGLSPDEIRAHLALMSYKPGWTFELLEDPFEGPVLRIVAVRLPNSYRAGEPTDLGVNSYLPPMETVDDLMRWLAWRLGRIELHEMREFLRYDGDVVFDPHQNPLDTLGSGVLNSHL